MNYVHESMCIKYTPADKVCSKICPIDVKVEIYISPLEVAFVKLLQRCIYSDGLDIRIFIWHT